MELPLFDNIELEILMHRDVHFGGNFSIMIDYYENDGVGVMEDYEIKTIKKMQKIEHSLKQNLSEVLLSDEAKKLIERAKKIYLELREVYEQKAHHTSRLIADLLLSEDEFPEKEIDAIISEGNAIVKPLIHLIESEDFYDPLFPGYGRGPVFAAKCLEELQNKDAVIPLFEALGKENFFTDEAIIKAIAAFGDHAKKFLMKTIKAKPYSKDNEYAAIVLGNFDTEDVAKKCLQVLEDREALVHSSLATYLLFNCANLQSDTDRKRFQNVLEDKALPKELVVEGKTIAKMWK